MVAVHSRSRGRWISEFERFVYRVSSRTARTTQRNPVSDLKTHTLAPYQERDEVLDHLAWVLFVPSYLCDLGRVTFFLHTWLLVCKVEVVDLEGCCWQWSSKAKGTQSSLCHQAASWPGTVVDPSFQTDTLERLWSILPVWSWGRNQDLMHVASALSLSNLPSMVNS